MTVAKDKGGSSREDAAWKAFMDAVSSGGSSSGGKDVYMGVQVTPSKGVRAPFSSAPGLMQRTKPRWMSVDEATGTFYSWTTKKQDDFLAKLKVSGLVQSDAGAIEAGKVWSALVTEAAAYGAQGKQVSPFDLLSRYVKSSGASEWKKDSTGRFEVNALTGERRYIGPQFSTTTATHTDLTDPATARAIAEKMFQDLMGRNPGKGEIGQFASALSSSEAANPAADVTTTQYDMSSGDAISSNTTSSGGVSADAKAMLAEDQIKKKREYGAVQAATTYQGALDDLVYGAPE